MTQNFGRLSATVDKYGGKMQAVGYIGLLPIIKNIDTTDTSIKPLKAIAFMIAVSFKRDKRFLLKLKHFFSFFSDIQIAILIAVETRDTTKLVEIVVGILINLMLSKYV